MIKIIETRNRASIYVMYHLIPLSVIIGIAAVFSFFKMLPLPSDFIKLAYGFVAVALITLVILCILKSKKVLESRKTKYVVLIAGIVEIAVINTLLSLWAFPLFILPVILALYFQSRKRVRRVAVISLFAFALSAAVSYYFSLGTFTEQKDITKFTFDIPQLITIAILEFLIFVILAVAAFFVSKFQSRISNYQNSMANTVAKDDQLGIYNKYQFEIELRRVLANNPDTEYNIIITDIEKFSVFNDLFGHEKGDYLLKSIASALGDFGGPDSVIGRLSDDHILCLIKRSKCNENELVERFFHTNNLSGSANYSVTVICGIYEINDRRMATNIMLERALIAVHAESAKSEGFAYYRDSMLHDARRNNKFLADLNDALNENQFEPYLQPQFDANGKVTGAEVLVRWMSPTRGMVPPDEFISACEEHGYISRLDRDMWIKACQVLAMWQEKGVKDLYLSVNVSKVDLFELDVLDIFTGLVKRYGINPARLHLEITETSMMKEFTRVIEIIKSLRRSGFVVEIDDFGTGFSSLGMLSEVVVDAIKVDSSFVKRLNKGLQAKIVVRTIAKMVKDLGTHAVVEGVETDEQLEFLKSVGFERFQGYYFSKAMPCNEFEKQYLDNM